MKVYMIGERGPGGWVKVGLTSGSVRGRLRGIQTGNPRDLEVLAVVKGWHRLEGALRLFLARAVCGEVSREWVSFSRVDGLLRRHACVATIRALALAFEYHEDPCAITADPGAAVLDGLGALDRFWRPEGGWASLVCGHAGRFARLEAGQYGDDLRIAPGDVACRVEMPKRLAPA